MVSYPGELPQSNASLEGFLLSRAPYFAGSNFYVSTPSLPTNIVDFRGFDASIILNLRGGIPRHIGISKGFPRKV